MRNRLTVIHFIIPNHDNRINTIPYITKRYIPTMNNPTTISINSVMIISKSSITLLLRAKRFDDIERLADA